MIAISQKKKEELEAKVAEIKTELSDFNEDNEYGIGALYASLSIYEKILSQGVDTRNQNKILLIEKI